MKRTLRNFLVCALLTAASGPAMSEPFDGVWQLGGGPFVIVDQNGANFLAIHLPANMGYWEAFFGNINANNVGVVSLLFSPYLTTYSATVRFQSSSQGTLTVTNCTPAANCILQTGQSAVLRKVY
ncbi:MAG: hypothetical protein H6953_11775 [Chromatiaceae bacterium]|nr:hypothetical protein [Chromatiaceae bacterium]MCP5315974.1 hypothetical protein [Chromatiaceae bacterium]